MSFATSLRLAARSLLKSPGFTWPSLLSLSLGLGATVAAWSVLYGVLLRPLPYERPDELVMLWGRFLAQGEDHQPSSGAEFVDLRDGNQSFSAVAALIPHLFNLTGDGDPERLIGARVSASLFPLLGVEATVGRTFLPEEDEFGRETAVLLTHGFWQRRFGGDRAVVGRAVTLNGRPYTVVGVLPERFQLDRQLYEIYVPVALNPAVFPKMRDYRAFKVYARLKPGVSLERAQGDLDRLARAMQAEHPASYAGGSGWGLLVTRLHDEVVGNVRSLLWLLAGTAALVLLIACFNVAGLILARNLKRGREVAIRTAFGGSRAHLVRQFLAEGLVLALASGAAGLGLALLVVRALAIIRPDGLPRLDEIRVDGGVVALALGVSLLTGLVFGLLPALQRTRSLGLALKAGGRGGETRSRLRARRALVVAEIALALGVVAAATLMVRTLLRLTGESPGFERANVLTMQLWLPPESYGKPAPFSAFFDELLPRLASLPGIDAASASSTIPLQGFHMWGDIEVEDLVRAAGEPLPSVEWFMVSPGHFETLGITRRAGRDFSRLDHAEAEPVAIIDEEVARTLFAGRDPLGKKLELKGGAGDGQRRTIVGVVAHVKSDSLGGESRPQVYVPAAQYPRPLMFLALRTTSDAAAVARAAREAVWSIDRYLAISKVVTLEQITTQALASSRFSTALLIAFALIALELAAVGVFGLMAYSVAQRSQEIGVRMALGADRGTVRSSVVREGLTLAAAGIALGIPVALALGKLMASQLYGVAAGDAATLAVVAVILLGAALAASYLPARAATRVAPAIALRAEPTP